MLSDGEKGQLISIWIIAGDKKGEIPHNAKVLQKVCGLDEMPDINKFIELGFLEIINLPDDATLTPPCQPDDAPEKRREEESRVEESRGEKEKAVCAEVEKTSTPKHGEDPLLNFPLVGGKWFPVFKRDVEQWQDTFQGVNVLEDLKKCRQWNIDNPKNRKTERGIRGHISAWLGRTQDRSRPKPTTVLRSGLSPREKRMAFLDKEQERIEQGVKDGSIDLGFGEGGVGAAVLPLPE